MCVTTWVVLRGGYTFHYNNSGLTKACRFGVARSFVWELLIVTSVWDTSVWGTQSTTTWLTGGADGAGR